MMELKHPEIISSLFAKSDFNGRIDVLAALVLDLFMEVEALRRFAVTLDEQRSGRLECPRQSGHNELTLSRDKSAYQIAYVDTAYVTHNNAGPSGGLDKLLTEFYPAAADEMGRAWREALLLERLGFSREEITAYKKAAEEAEMLT